MAQNLLEAVAEGDDDLMEKYLEGEDLTEDEINATIRKMTCACKMFPVTCGSSYKNKGVQPLLDAIIAYMPAPTDVADIKGVDPETAKKQLVLPAMMLPLLPLPSRSQPTPMLAAWLSSVSTPVN